MGKDIVQLRKRYERAARKSSIACNDSERVLGSAQATATARKRLAVDMTPTRSGSCVSIVSDDSASECSEFFNDELSEYVITTVKQPGDASMEPLDYRTNYTEEAPENHKEWKIMLEVLSDTDFVIVDECTHPSKRKREK